MSSLTLVLLLAALLAVALFGVGLLAVSIPVVLLLRAPRPAVEPPEAPTVLMALPGREGRRRMETLETDRVRRIA